MTPDSQALLEQAHGLDRANRPEEARSAYEAFLRLVPDHPDGWADFGGLLLVMGHPGEALAACQRSLALVPDYPSALVNFALALMHLDRLDEAEFAVRGVLAKDSRNVDALLSLADIYFKKNELAKSRAALGKILEVQPSHLGAQRRLNNLFIYQGDWPALRKDMERQLLVFSGAEAEYEQSLLRLLFGELSEAWDGFEKRLAVPGRFESPVVSAQPRWTGGSFKDKTLLVHYEQGLGDSLMCLRYLPAVKALGGTVVLLVQHELEDLAGTCGGVDRILKMGEPIPPFDLQVSLMSLPSAFRTGLPDLAGAVPYLEVPDFIPHRKDIARALDPLHADTRIGLVWAGNPSYKKDKERSIPVAALAPLAPLQGVSWFSFQLGEREVPTWPNLVSLAPLLSRFSDTAYALSGMDLVITVDTAVAHLSGAMAIPTLLLLPFQPDWRWALGRNDSPWYPSMRLYRQSVPGDWDSVIRKVVSDLGGPSSSLKNLDHSPDA